MSNRQIIRGKIYTEEFEFKYGQVECEDGYIKKVTFLDEGDLSDEERQLYVIPGLVDIHMHGACGIDVCSADADDLKRLSAYEQSCGVTSFCPTTMTLPVGRLTEVCRTIKDSKIDSIIGINLEGPFISKEKCGAQDEKSVLDNSSLTFLIDGKNVSLEGIADTIRFLKEESGNLVKISTIAPEIKGALDAISELKDDIVISLGHTNADYDTCKNGFESGADHVTHLFNAMSYVNHREPGLIGAAFDNKDVFVELICDGNHVHPSIVRSAFASYGANRIVLISDSTQATGCEDGKYFLGNEEIVKEGSAAHLADNADILAGSVSNLFDCFRCAVVDIGIELESAVRAVTYNPAKSIGAENAAGVICEGRRANILVINNEKSIVQIITCGV